MILLEGSVVFGTKRDNGQGSICKRNDGRWVGKIQIGTTKDGKAKIKSVYGKTEAEAKRKLKAFNKDLIKNDFIEIQKITVKEYMNNWLDTVKILTVKPSSYDKIEAVLNNQIYPSIGDIQIANLKSNDIQLLINTLSDDKYSYSTISQTYHIIKDCFKTAVIKRDILYSPVNGVSLPKKTEFKKDYVKFFTEEEVEKIVKECLRKYSNGNNMHRLGSGIVLLLYTGMRIGELLSLRWEDVDLEKKQLNVKYTMSRVKDRSENADKKYINLVDTTKTKSSTRIIPLINQSIDALNELKKVSVSDEYVITSKKGELIIPYSFRTVMNSVLRNCGIEEKGAHSLRHTFASMLFKKGVDVKTVSELLGHSDVTITYNTYIHLIQEQKEHAVSLLELEKISSN